VRPLRGLLLLVLALGACLALAPASSADPRPTCAFDGTLSSTHFTVHWQTVEADKAACPNGTDYYDPQAGETLAAAERAYDTFVTTWGFPPPVDDGDGHTDIYVYTPTDPILGELSAIYASDGIGLGGTAPGWFVLNPNDAKRTWMVAAGVFHAIQSAIWDVPQPAFGMGAAEWAGRAVYGFPEVANGSMLTVPDITLDCAGVECDEHLFNWIGTSRWPFFQYLQDRLGSTAVRDLWATIAGRATPGPDAVGALVELLGARSLTLAEFYNGFAAALGSGSIKAANVQGVLPTTIATLKPGVAAGTTQTTTTAVDHLATRFVAIVPGSGVGDVCFAATLKVEVKLPSGIGAVPSFYAKEYGGVTPFTVSGSTATLTTPWDTCTWADGRTAIVALPNPSATENGQAFTVTTTLTAVDLTTIVSPDAPVEPTEPRPVVPTAGAVPPPTLSFHGPETVPVARNGAVTLAFFASNRGTVEIRAAGKALKAVKVRAGRNVVKLRLPVARKQAKSKRTSLATRPARLTLTSVSPSGQVGATVSRKLRYAV
jgi:hypothetical protein